MTTCCWKFWKFRLNLNRTRLHKIRRLRARNNYLSFYHKNLSFISSIFSSFYFFASNKKLTIHRKTQLMQFMLKSQQKVDIKLSKICQSHQKLSEWQKVASRFTEIVVKMWKCRSRFKLFVGLFVELLDSLKQGTTGNWILMTQMLAPANRAWVFWLCWVC